MSRKRPHHGNRRRGTHPKAHKARALVTGTLRIERPGSARVDTPEGTFAVARRGVREGMDGDEVQVSLVPMHGRGGERVAYVQGVLQRAHSGFVGTFSRLDPLGAVSPLDGRIARDFFVLPEDESPLRMDVRDGDVVRVRIVEYPTRTSAGVVTIEARLGSAEELDVAVEMVIASYGLTTEFSASALREAEDVRANVEAELSLNADRRDLRDVACVTIDPTDARDFDDAVGARRCEDGYELDVHIADVTHYLPWNGSMDLEARARACSVYLVDRVLPMLPEQLCNDVCSLRPNEDRLAMTVRMRLDARGMVRSSEAFSSAIHSSARLSYDEVEGLLEGNGLGRLSTMDDGEGLGDMLLLLDEIAQLRVARRRERGAIDFATVESKVILDEEGVPIDAVVRKRTRATGLVEEAMLLANECVAKLLASHDVQTAYRVHEQPSPDDLAQCLPALRSLGLIDADVADRLVAADPHAIGEVLARAQETDGAYLANTLLLRAQKRAIYLPHNEGHYALGARAYCHFTSPIRRYPDVLVHRALKRLLAYDKDGKAAHEEAEMLPQLCRACSDRERVADAAGYASQRVKMAQLYGGRVGMRYSGVVVGCERYGLFVMLDDTGAEGLLPVRALGDEWFVFDNERMTLTGESSGRTWHMGKRVAIEVVGVDVARGRIDFALAGK